MAAEAYHPARRHRHGQDDYHGGDGSRPCTAASLVIAHNKTRGAAVQRVSGPLPQNASSTRLLLLLLRIPRPTSRGGQGLYIEKDSAINQEIYPPDATRPPPRYSRGATCHIVPVVSCIFGLVSP